MFDICGEDMELPWERQSLRSSASPLRLPVSRVSPDEPWAYEVDDAGVALHLAQQGGEGEIFPVFDPETASLRDVVLEESPGWG